MVEVIEIEDCICILETPKALAVGLNNDADLNKAHWIPKSVIHDDSEVYAKGHRGKLVIPEWLAIKEGIEP